MQMNTIGENSQFYPTFSEWCDKKLSNAELEALKQLDSLRFARIQKQQLERMTVDSAYEGDTESSFETEMFEKQSRLRIRYKRRHSRIKRL